MSSDHITEPCDIAVLIPCYNEAQTVEKVVQDFRRALPRAQIYVFDNNSSDDTAALASKAGAIVRHEKRQGKGFVIANMLASIDADLYVMVDGDDTYPAEKAPALLQPLMDGKADMVVGQRLTEYTDQSFRPLHVMGNRLVRDVINLVFGSRLVDVMSGYRAFTRQVAEHLPVVASGFDVETEMTLQLLFRNFVVHEVAIPYRERPEGSTSKLRTFHDGALVLLKILGIFKAYKPLSFFGGMGLVVFLAGLVPAMAAVGDYARDGQLDDTVAAMLAMSFVSASFLLITVGIMLHTLNFRILEMTNLLSKQIERKHRQDGGGLPGGEQAHQCR